MTVFKTLSLATILSLTTLAGCSSLYGDRDDDDDRRDRVTRSDRYDDRYDDTRLGGDRIDARDLRISGVPRDARVVDESRGAGDTLNYTVRDRGKAYLADLTKGSVVWDKSLRDGDRVSVDPDHNRIAVNGKEDVDIDLKGNNRFALFFEPSR